MIIELDTKPIDALSWREVHIGKTYQNVENPALVVVPFVYQPDNTKTDVIMALPLSHYREERGFVAFYPCVASRWVEVESKIKIQLKA